jgi:hypothetical protein
VQNLEEKFVVKYQISAPAYAKTAGDLLLVRPRVLGSDAGRGSIPSTLKQKARGATHSM